MKTLARNEASETRRVGHAAVNRRWLLIFLGARPARSGRAIRGARSDCDTRSLADQAVVFDLDGTLVDLRAVYVLAHQLTAREVLAIELDEARILELMAAGSPIREHMAHLDEEAADRLVEVFVERYRQQRADLAQPFAGVDELLACLRDRDIRIAVVTSKLRDDAVPELAATRLEEYVEVLVTFEDTNQHKPSPAPQLEALRRLGASGGVGVGDLPSDIASARAAGLRALGVSWGYGSVQGLREAGAERVCETAADLEKAIQERLDSAG